MLWKQYWLEQGKVVMVQVNPAHRMKDLNQASSLEEQPAPVSLRNMAVLVGGISLT